MKWHRLLYLSPIVSLAIVWIGFYVGNKVLPKDLIQKWNIIPLVLTLTAVIYFLLVFAVHGFCTAIDMDKKS